MSFSGTPLGQGRRLDHQTFLKGGSATQVQSELTNSPPRRVPSINSIPLSYAYGAPTLNRSPSKGGNSTSPRTARNASPSRSAAGASQTQSQPGAEDEGERTQDEIALARYARLKQRNQALANRPGSSLGPGVITTPPQPTAASFKDTSVNIASAFNQAANSYDTMPPNHDTQGRSYPRSTSVEYESQAQSTSHRRLAVPPNRLAKSSSYSKPSSKPTSRVDSSVDQSADSVDSAGRAKSPFDHLAELTRRAVSPAVYLLRQRSQEPEERPPTITKSSTEKTLVGDNTISYDYAEEEAEFQNSLKPPSKRAQNSTHKRGRMSLDNKAYHPSDSELESESEDDLDDGKKARRRRAKNKDGPGGPLNSLPVAGYDKRKKKKAKGKGGAGDDASLSDERVSELRSGTPGTVRPGSKPPSRAGSILRQNHNLVEENSRSGDLDASVDIEQGLEPISEAEEAPFDTDNQPDINSYSDSSNVSLSHAPPRRRWPIFSIGAFLGSIVNFGFNLGHGMTVTILRLLAMFTLLVGRVLGTIVDVLFRRPFLLVRRSRGSVSHLGKYIVVGIAMYLAWFALRHPSLRSISLPFTTSRPVIEWNPSSEFPADGIERLVSRVLKLEKDMADLRSDTMSSHTRLENDVRKHRDSAARITKLEGQMDKESLRALRAEEEYRQAAAKNAEALRKEMKVLERQIEEASKSSGAPVTVEGLDDIKAHVRLLAERLATTEEGLREAQDTTKKLQSQVASAKADSAAPTWWNRASSSSAGSGLTIKTTDGQDVGGLIEHLVDGALSRHVKDDVGRTDYALASGGASVIPSLTSAPISMKASGLLTFFSGKTPAMSPVVALHHETHLGYCWPFEGSVGQLGVKLSRRIFPADVTIDHVARDIAVDIGSAPREMEIWGLVEGKDNFARYQEWIERRPTTQDGDAVASGEEEIPEQPRSLPRNAQYMRLASFMYDIDAPKHIQTFPVSKEVKKLNIDFGVVVLMVKSNWGQEEFTCLYRFRLHGDQFQQQPPPPPYQEQPPSKEL